MAVIWQSRRPAGFSAGRSWSAARSDFGFESQSRMVSGRWKVKTSRERGFGSRPSVKRVMTPVLS